MLAFLKNLLALALSIFDSWKSREKSRDRNAARKAIATHDRQALNTLLQSRRDKQNATD